MNKGRNAMYGYGLLQWKDEYGNPVFQYSSMKPEEIAHALTIVINSLHRESLIAPDGAIKYGQMSLRDLLAAAIHIIRIAHSPYGRMQ